jgi:coproporphyrinogen III oxidase-like Fe-S oxidoreductase
MDRLPVGTLRIMDDSFLFHSDNWFEEFRDRYKAQIGLPFSCLSNPKNISRAKLQLLVDCGLHHIQVGLQSGSDRINKTVYGRKTGSQDFLKAMDVIGSLRPIPNLTIDVIFDNPFETDNDKQQTIDVLSKVKIPFKVATFALTYYPGTRIYALAEKAGFLDDSIKKRVYDMSYHDVKRDCFNEQIMKMSTNWKPTK